MTDDPMFERAELPKRLADAFLPSQPRSDGSFTARNACPACGSDAIELTYKESSPYWADDISIRCSRCGASTARACGAPYLALTSWRYPEPGEVVLADGTPFKKGR